MPYCVLLMLLFRIVLLLFAVPPLVRLIVLLPEPTPNRVVVLLFPTRLTFLIVLLVAGSLSTVVCSQTTADEVPESVLVIVRSREELPAFEPSMVTKSAPFRMMTALALAPVMTGLVPGAGLIVIVAYEAELAPLAFRTAAAVSVVLPEISIVIVPCCFPALMASNASFTVV